MPLLKKTLKKLKGKLSVYKSLWVIVLDQAFFSSITDMCENGGKRPNPEVSIGFTKEQADTIRRIRSSKDSWDMLGVKPGSTRYERVFFSPI